VKCLWQLNGKKITDIRDQKGLTLLQFSKLTGLSVAYLSKIENGKIGRPSMNTVYSIASALRVTVDDIVEKAS